MRTFRGLLVVTLALISPARLLAQQGEAVPPPIDVKVATAASTTAPTGPLIVAPGTSVRIFGASVPLGGGSQIKIDIVKPSKKTASVHVSNILRKLGVTSRVDAAAVAQRLGVA